MTVNVAEVLGAVDRLTIERDTYKTWVIKLCTAIREQDIIHDDFDPDYPSCPDKFKDIVEWFREQEVAWLAQQRQLAQQAMGRLNSAELEALMQYWGVEDKDSVVL